MENEIEEAQWAQAKALYMEFRSIKDISRATGLRFFDIRKKAYGPGGCTRPSTDSWYYERLDVNREEFQELGARNLWLAQQITQKALFESFESLKVLAKRKNKKTGEKVPLKPHEIKALTDSISTLDRLLRLRQGLPTEITELQTEAIAVEPTLDVALDMNKVAEALRLDPAMRKLLGGASDREGSDQGGYGSKQPGGDPEGLYVRDQHGRFAKPASVSDGGDTVLEIDGNGREGAEGVRGAQGANPRIDTDAGRSGAQEGHLQGNDGAEPTVHTEDLDGSSIRRSEPGKLQDSDDLPGGETGISDYSGDPFADEYE